MISISRRKLPRANFFLPGTIKFEVKLFGLLVDLPFLVFKGLGLKNYYKTRLKMNI